MVRARQACDPEVLVCGAGPTGLTLAVDLARRGIACTVLEQTDRLFVGSRGKGLQPRTLEVLDDLGVIDRVMAAGVAFPPFRLHAGHEVVWTRPFLDMVGVREVTWRAALPYPDAWLIPQSRTNEILAERFLALGGRIDFGARLVGFDQDADGATAWVLRGGPAETIRARYLVGCDGGGSFVRKHLGLAFDGETLAGEYTLIGDVRVDGLTGECCHLFTRDGDMTERFSLWWLPGSDYFQLVVTLYQDEAPETSLEAVQRLLDERSGRTDLRLHDLAWISTHVVNVRMVDQMRVGRVLLAGDAAHVHSSSGGQGLNTSVQDAYNLGWKLGAALSASGRALNTYEEERLPVAEDLLGRTSRMHGRDFDTNLVAKPAANRGANRGDQAADAPAPPEVFQLGISYRGSSLSQERRTDPGRIQAGDRAPDALCRDALGAPIRLFDLFRGPHWTLIVFVAEGEPVPPWPGVGCRRDVDLVSYTVLDCAPCTPRGHVVVDVDTRVRSAFDVAPGESVAFLVRPDGHIALATTDPADVPAYLAAL